MNSMDKFFQEYIFNPTKEDIDRYNRQAEINIFMKCYTKPELAEMCQHYVEKLRNMGAK